MNTIVPAPILSTDPSSLSLLGEGEKSSLAVILEVYTTWAGACHEARVRSGLGEIFFD